MSKAEKFIQEHTRNCSNVFVNPQLGGTEENHPWLTPDQARRAVEIAKEEVIEDLSDKAKVSSGLDGFYYGQGYKQAEKDLELTWEDIRDICRMWMESKIPFGVTGEALSIEVLKRFKAQKEGEKISDIKSGDKN